MPRPSLLSIDLRERAAAAVADGASSAGRASATARETGDVAPKPRGGDQRSHAIEAHADTILALYEAQPTLFLSELRAALSKRGIAVSPSGLSRFFKRHGITRKKTRRTRPSSSGRT